MKISLLKRVSRYIALHKYDVVACVILLLALVVRLSQIDYPLAEGGGESSRDFLVAKYILLYREFPSLGPWNGVFGGIFNSPFYYYLLTLFVVPHFSFLGFTYFHAFMQVVGIAGMYLLGRQIFSAKTGMVAILLIGFTADFLWEATYVFQPFVMQPFLTFCYLAFFLYIKSGRVIWVYISAILLAISIAIHMSSLAVMPVLLVGYMYHKKISGVKAWSIVFGIILVLFVPVFLYIQSTTFPLVTTNFSIFVASFPELIKNLFKTTETILKIFGMTYILPPNIYWMFFAGVILGVVSLYVISDRVKRVRLIFILALFLVPVLCVSVLKDRDPFHYINPALIPFGIIVAEVFVRNIWNRVPYLLGVILLFGIVLVSTSFFSSFLPHQYSPTNREVVNQTTDKMIKEINKLKQENRYNDYHYFNVQGLRTGSYNVVSAALFVPLEDKLEKKLVKVDDASLGISAINENPKYMFVGCFSYFGSYSRLDCLKEFKKYRSDYEFEKLISDFEQLSVFLFKKS